jgi:hypothetical protein
VAQKSEPGQFIDAGVFGEQLDFREHLSKATVELCMRKLLSLFPAAGIATAATHLANPSANSQDFAVSIVGFRESDYQYNREGLPL